MLDEQQRLNLVKADGGIFEIEVNWSDDFEVKDCKMLRFHDGEKHFDLKRDDLLSILLAVGDMETQKVLLPKQIRRVRTVERLLHGTMKAKRSYTKGDRIEFTVPWIDQIALDGDALSGDINALIKQTKSMRTKHL